MKSVSLHHHTTFSFLDGYGTPEDHAARAAELGMGALAVTEHGNVSSHVRHEKACHGHDIKPLFGVEAYTAATDEQRFKWHLTLLAMNQSGYQNLLRMVSESYEDFYYEPTVLGDVFRDYQDGLIVLSGCAGSLLACTLVGGKGLQGGDGKAALRIAGSFKELLGDRYYLEVQAFPTLDRTRAINELYENIGKHLRIPLVATQDVHYPYASQNQIQLLLHGIGRGGGYKKSLEDMERSWGYDVPLTFNTDRELYDKMVATGLSPAAAREACRNTYEIAERCTVKLQPLKELKFPDPRGSDAVMKEWLRDGWMHRRIDERPNRSEYVERVRTELPLIVDKGFVDYFLVIADAVKFAKDSGIPVGPARGSAAASLVCYLLRITEVDPIPFPNLLFARFIDPNRHDLPDIDLDFDDERRGEVRDYLVRRYGEERVGNIGTFVNFKGKNSLEDVARVHNIPKYELAAFKDFLVERQAGDLRAASTLRDTIDMFPQAKAVFDRHPELYKALDLEGNLRGMSVHAAGLVVANDPLTNSCAVYVREDKKTGERLSVVSLDKYDAEYLNVLKIDFLGLTTMGMIRIALELIGMTLEELYAVPLDDPETLRGFQEGDVVGVFQFDGRAMRSVNREVQPDNFNEVADVNALARPGPLHSGATSNYIMIKFGKAQREHIHPLLDRITGHTRGQIIYQEQILQTVQGLANFTWEEAARVRKLVSKKRGEQEFNRQQQRFVEGCAENGLGERDALKVWRQLVTSGAYAFNVPHCISYGKLAFWCMWLKRHHPQAFYVAALRKYEPKTRSELQELKASASQRYDAKIKGMQLLRDAARKGIPIYPPHANKSGITWEVEGEGIRAGLSQISGIGIRAASDLVRDRPDGGWARPSAILEARPKGAAYSTKTVRLLDEIRRTSDPFGLEILSSNLGALRQRLAPTSYRPTHTSSDVPYEPRQETVTWVGVWHERNLKDLYELHRSRTGEELDPASVRDPDLVNWVVIIGEDDTDLLTITVSRWQYPKLKERIWKARLGKDLIVVRGTTTNQYRRAIYVSDLWVVREEDNQE